MTPITKIAMPEPKADTSDEQSKKIFQEALALKDECLHPETKQPYIKSMVGGRGNLFNPAAGSKDSTLALIAEFASEEDMNYFDKQDEAHLSFIKRNKEYMAKIQVLPFFPNTF